ncbi:hypothetical protein MKL09_13750 [Methylobacterium sp. J-048]|uniref:hypothetical protein n=1 Tax=Methylobacterium sp. J-048 TaxID=2836635 RepID=UPI001FB8D4F2|nr:hypothetical protein [Methylobacterium sp. J-048]MCJ2057620.1 hypothetical protein [Methylobacterium sp. J-048]
MPSSPKRNAYLVAVPQKRLTVRVYAVLTTTRDEALGAMARNVPPNANLEIVGGLSPALAERLRL